MPDKFFNFVTDFYMHLINLISQFYETEVISSGDFDSKKYKNKIVFIISLSHWEEHHKKILDLSDCNRLVLWHDDFFFRNEEELKNHIKIMDRAKCIMHASKTAYELMYPEYIYKSFWIPMFATSDFHLDYNQNPLNRCLLVGQVTENHYPLRSFVCKNRSPFIHVEKHPGYVNPDNSKIKHYYAKMINSFFCCITDSGKTYGALKYRIDGSSRPLSVDSYLESKNIDINKFSKVGQVLLKIFEIISCGSLLLTDEFAPEMELLGYKNQENYLQVNADNALEIIEDCCVNQYRYEAIRRNGYELSKSQTSSNREKILKEVVMYVENF